MSLSKKKMGEEMQKPLLLPQKKWHNQLCESARMQKAQDTQSQPVSDVQFLAGKSFLKGKSKRNPNPLPRREVTFLLTPSAAAALSGFAAALLPLASSSLRLASASRRLRCSSSRRRFFSSSLLLRASRFSSRIRWRCGKCVYKLSAQTWRKPEGYSQGKKPDLPASLIFCF